MLCREGVPRPVTQPRACSCRAQADIIFLTPKAPTLRLTIGNEALAARCRGVLDAAVLCAAPCTICRSRCGTTRYNRLCSRPNNDVRDDNMGSGANCLTLYHAPRLILDAMADCCCPGPNQLKDSVLCRHCGTSSKPVESLTVKALLTEAALARYEPAPYRFCPDDTCGVVYFAETGTAFTTDDVRDRVWQKEPPGHRTLCYCFGEDEADIAREIEQTGQSCAVQRVRSHIAAGRCACEMRNPRGACCLGDLHAAVERLRLARVSRS